MFSTNHFSRARKDSQYSGFSQAYEYTTYSNNYNPDLIARAVNENTIELTFIDNSYNDYEYLIDGVPYPENTFSKSVFMTDSGRTVKFSHHPVNPGTTYRYTVTMFTYDDEQHSDVASASATTPGSQACAGIGSIEREVWTSVKGYGISNIPVNDPPNKVSDITIFETPSNNGDNYGARVRGYVCTPKTGNYTFWISSDDNSELPGIKILGKM